MRVAHVFKGRVHEIFSTVQLPDWPPYPDGVKPLLIDVSDIEVEEGYLYDASTGQFSPFPILPSPEDIIASIQAVKAEQLAILNSPSYQLKAESDPHFAELIRQSIEEWNNIEGQPGYPSYIDFPELWDEDLQ